MNVVAIRVNPADAINREYQLSKEAADRWHEHVLKTGELLIEQKRHVPKGEFRKWIEANCKFSYSAAKLYMRAVRWKGNGITFPSLNEMLKSSRKDLDWKQRTSLRATKRKKTRYIRDMNFGDDGLERKKLCLPEGHDLAEFNGFAEAANMIYRFHQLIKDLDPVPLYRGGNVPGGIEKLRPHLKRCHEFFAFIRAIDHGVAYWGRKPDDFAKHKNGWEATLDVCKDDPIQAGRFYNGAREPEANQNTIVEAGTHTVKA